ncbi:unnamed protein product, partial [marine sediment metagenome]
FAMELYQRGIISRQETDGLKLEWGDEETMLEMLNRIAYRKGFGNTLAEGSVIAAEKIGRGSEKYVMTVKCLEIPWTDPRSATRGWSFGYIVGPRGDNVKMNHTTIGDVISDGWGADDYDMLDEVREKIFGSPPKAHPFSYRGKAMTVKWVSEIFTALNTFCSCIFTVRALGPTIYSRLISACTGWDIKPDELMRLGEKIINLRRAYAARDGFTRKDDRWPDRFYNEPLPDGPSKGKILSREETNRA